MEEYKVNFKVKNVQIRRKVLDNKSRYDKIYLYTDADPDG